MNKPLPVIPSQLTSSTVRSSEFQVIIWLYLWTFGDTMWKLLSVSYLSLTQIDLFHLRERDLLRRFAEEVSEYQSRGESKESAFILVRILPDIFFLLPSYYHCLTVWNSFVFQSYQLAGDLGRAFSERAILKTFMEAESTLPAGTLKVNQIISCWIFLTYK